MSIEQQRLAIVFNEWIARYAANPHEFGQMFDEQGNVIKGYAEACARHFEELSAELEAAGKLPKNE